MDGRTPPLEWYPFHNVWRCVPNQIPPRRLSDALSTDQAGFLRAWNDIPGQDSDTRGWVIVDSMFNIPLLYWASEETKDPRFAAIAVRHADTVLANFIRPDGSVRHIVEFNPATGAFVRDYGGQGYAQGSSWTRGQT